MSIANNPNLVGYLKYPAPSSDGSFAICIANGEGDAFWKSIPEEYRPVLDKHGAGMQVETILSGNMTAIGSVFLPFLLKNKETGERMRYILRAIVLPGLFMPMFISGNERSVVEQAAYSGREGPVFTLKCGDGTCPVQGQ
ncbi:uncharacterized protein PHACADRAFT_212097 [Phanerochaete carnosa HHB-10118-sp]|uniref:Uncharacterized protein n=1 Tax=Phanerochaete carnosa (strain HHB-10118-sp) TaxID=650164 RepID=K5USL0_PHACS|nr:uncharacterized protein PHACADRAFT_212097 [Phanerochaete carnosa HHB-10118-sp]EKM52896.1 hypothetical protein PHACADRAFT_212097 [Phanerochaete carnosa HHB-10118-sp]